MTVTSGDPVLVHRGVPGPCSSRPRHGVSPPAGCGVSRCCGGCAGCSWWSGWGKGKEVLGVCGCPVWWMSTVGVGGCCDRWRKGVEHARRGGSLSAARSATCGWYRVALRLQRRTFLLLCYSVVAAGDSGGKPRRYSSPPMSRVAGLRGAGTYRRPAACRTHTQSPQRDLHVGASASPTVLMCC